jgi:hypothetical protein
MDRIAGRFFSTILAPPFAVGSADQLVSLDSQPRHDRPRRPHGTVDARVDARLGRDRHLAVHAMIRSARAKIIF